MTIPTTSQQAADKRKISDIKRHIFLCIGDKCCNPERGNQIWQYLKARLATLSQDDPHIYRTKANCLRICADGPVGVVYPDGIWYRMVDERAIDLIIDQHLIHGKPVEQYILQSRQTAQM